MSYSCLSPRLLLNLFDDDDRAVTFRPTIEFTIYSRVARSRTRVFPRFDIHHLPSSPSFSYFRSFLQFERNESKSGWRKPSNKKHDAATDTISVKNNQCPVAAHLWYIYTHIYVCISDTIIPLVGLKNFQFRIIFLFDYQNLKKEIMKNWYACSFV